jgi:acetyl-CoA carboxylase biotin carboxyl carrier protein
LSFAEDGRVYRPELEALVHDAGGGRVEVRASGVGLWRGAPARGVVVQPGTSIGELEVLGVLHRLVAPRGARGMVVELPAGERRARVPVAWGEPLMVLDPEAAGVALADEAGAATQSSEGALVFRSPSSGRFYARPSPGAPLFVQAGDEVAEGQTVCVLEVMKTFNRVQYGGAGLPARARVTRVVPANEDDLAAGDVILELEVP